MKRLPLPASFVLAASFQLLGCTTPNDDSTEVTGPSSTSTATSVATSSTSTSGNTTSSAVSTGSGGEGGAGGATPSSGLVIERFEIANASTGKGTPTTAPDYSTKIIAAAIQADAAATGCIDLRSVGFSGAGSTIVAETVVALLSAPLSDATVQAITTNVCSLTPSGCTVTSTVTSQALAESAMEQPIWGPDGFQTGSLYFPLEGHGPMPRMSNACVSGLYVDSWNHAANTPEAKAYLTDIGVDLTSDGLQLQLDRKDGDAWVYVFGLGMIEPM